MDQSFAELYTPEGKTLSGIPWDVYPRPQMRRDSFINLNGTWDFTLSKAEALPETYDEQILVPFAPESLLSGVHHACPEGDYLFYRRTFLRPEGEGRVLLHVGAADQCAAVYVNGTLVGEHEGGYEHFSFDITEALQAENTLVIRCVDKLSTFVMPYGKQCAKRGGMWYTPVSGIWQTVWMEVVPQVHVAALHIRNGADWAEITADGVTEGVVTVQTPEGMLEVPMVGGKARVEVAEPHMWSPEDPYLYDFTLRAGEDTVQSYFALRTLAMAEVNGTWRLLLNGEPYFFHGLLDQGYWSDGLFLPAQPVGYERDILAMKALGYNTLRKHIKLEPEQFYYDCDRLGMVVFQDMVNNGDYNYRRDTLLPTVGLKHRNDSRLHRDPETRAWFLKAMAQTVAQLDNHPCICYWTIFNEGWGQFESTKA